jgi:hypothetical protein
MASDLVQRRVRVILAGGGEVGALAAKAATSTIPILIITSSAHGPDTLLKTDRDSRQNAQIGVGSFIRKRQVCRLLFGRCDVRCRPNGDSSIDSHVDRITTLERGVLEFEI